MYKQEKDIEKPKIKSAKVKNVIPNVHPTNSLILPDGKIFKVQKKRQRKILSCIPCHQRKIKCARETPTCSNCEILAHKNPTKLHEIISACKYFDNDKRKNLKKKGVNIDLGSNSDDATDVNKSSENIKNEMDVKQNMAIAGIPTNKSSKSPEVSSSTVDFMASQQFNTEYTPTNREPEYQEPTDNNKNHYDLIFQSNQQTESQPINSLLELNAYSEYSTECSNQYVPFIELLPSKEKSDKLVQTFEENVHSVLPIMDLKNFKKKYHEFWYCGLFLKENIEKLYEYSLYFKNKYDSIPERISNFLYWYNKTECTLTPSNLLEFYSSLFAIYYSSVVSSVYEYLPEVHNSVDSITIYQKEVNQYYEVFQKFNDEWLNQPKVMSLSILQLNVLIQSVINLKAGRSLINISKILRICQFYQMNRDPVIFHGLKDKELVQTRRLIWWQMLLLDNLISFFLNLSPLIKLSDFDTSLLIENLDDTSNSTIMYLNCQYRYVLIMDDLNVLVNGLNVQLRAEEINNLKIKINDLYITCQSTISKMTTEYNSNVENRQQSLDHYQYFIFSLHLLSDKILIMLQKKIILNPYFVVSENDTHVNLNLTLTSLQYNYSDLIDSLLPSLLHYLHLFLGLSTKNMMRFNWKIKNYIPIDELILLMQIFATNINSGHTQQNDNEFYDFNMKVFLIDQTILSLVNTWHMKLSSVNKLISLVSKIWRIMILKYGLDVECARANSDKFVYPSPINANESVLSNPTRSSSGQYGVNCANIAPRSIRMASAITNSADFEFSPNSMVDIMNFKFSNFPNTPQSLVSPLGRSDNQTKKIIGLQEIENLAKTIEQELNSSTGQIVYDKTNLASDNGWANLGTDESTNVSIDDFHFYKNLKNDVIRLFKLVA